MTCNHFHFPVNLLKAWLVTLAFLCLGITTSQAQNYKPLQDAITDVQAAVVQLEQNSQAHTQTTATGAPAPKTNYKVGTRVAYFNEFVRIAKTMKETETAAAVTQLDINLPVSSTPEPRKSELIKARAALIELITL